jgi:hypothetical protein
VALNGGYRAAFLAGALCAAGAAVIGAVFLRAGQAEHLQHEEREQTRAALAVTEGE